MRSRSFTLYAWILVAFALAVVGWGAFVRATGSGAGCGNHWPLCNGQILPRSPEIETLIEFLHRLTSGVIFLMTCVLLVWAFRLYPRASWVRTGAVLSLLFMVSEAAVGAGLVLFGLVADDASFSRAWVMVFHLCNTFLLLSSLTFAAWASSRPSDLQMAFPPRKSLIVLVTLAALFLVGASGAIAALGDTLFPSMSLAEALEQDFSSSSHFLIRLRVYHPFIALFTGLLVVFMAVRLVGRNRPPEVSKLAVLTGLLFLGQLGVGLVNLLLLAPVWLQLIHLLLADLIWISASVLAFNLLSARQSPAGRH